MTLAPTTDRPPDPGPLLLTGATGFIGMEVLARFLERSDRHVHVLVRAEGEEAANARLRSTIACLFGSENAHAGRVSAVAGDIQRPYLGIDQDHRESLAERVTDVIHSAASVSFTLPLQESREINVAGTRRMLEFAGLCNRRGGLRHFSYISTAYVAGTHVGEFGEDELDVGQRFRNPYERSKFEAERLVREHGGDLPIQIYRPSIVVGEQVSGWTASFNVLYSPLKAFARGSLPALPARRSAPVDVVPVDYVADAVFELTNQATPELGTFNLVAGDRATTVGRLIDLSADHLGRRRPLVLPPKLYKRVVLPLLLRRGADRIKAAVERMGVFFPYFAMNVRYRNDRARRQLEPAGVVVPAVESYFGRLLDFAIKARWGRESIARADAHRSLGQEVQTLSAHGHAGGRGALGGRRWRKGS